MTIGAVAVCGVTVGAAVEIPAGALPSQVAIVIATSPDIPVLEMILGLGAVAVVLPVLVYPMSYTLWQAVDLAMHPPDTRDPDTPRPRP